MASSQTVSVNEARRTVVFKDGQRLELSNVTAFNSSGTMLRLWADEGFFMLNTSRINYHQIQQAYRADEATDMAEVNKEPGLQGRTDMTTPLGAAVNVRGY
jgi:hypothetical protein